MSQMVEQVARALCRRVLAEEAAKGLAEGRGDARSMAAAVISAVEHNWPSFADEARAAIAAMREPTEAMIEAPPPIAGENPGVREIWQDMIDEALKRT